jgi:hypothetical protein
VQDDYGLAGFKKATDLKRSHPHLKVKEKPRQKSHFCDEEQLTKFVSQKFRKLA